MRINTLIITLAVLLLDTRNVASASTLVANASVTPSPRIKIRLYISFIENQLIILSLHETGVSRYAAYALAIGSSVFINIVPYVSDLDLSYMENIKGFAHAYSTVPERPYPSLHYIDFPSHWLHSRVQEGSSSLVNKQNQNMKCMSCSSTSKSQGAFSQRASKALRFDGPRNLKTWELFMLPSIRLPALAFEALLLQILLLLHCSPHLDIMMSIYASTDALVFEKVGCCVALALGLITWIILHFFEVRGDHALGYFISVFALLYLGLQSMDAAEYASLSPPSYCVLFALTYIISALVSTAVYRLSPFHPLFLFPGPLTWRISTLFLCITVYGGKSHLKIDQLHKKYGRTVRIGPNMLSINSPDAAGILNSSVIHMEKSDVYKQPAIVKGVSLFFKQEKREHANRRKLWAKALSTSAVKEFYPALARRTEQLIQLITERMRDDGVVNILQCVELWSYDLMGDMAFGGYSGFEFMRTGDQNHLIQRGHDAQAILLSFGHCRWLMDLLWHVPVSKSVHGLRLMAASIMRRRVEAQDVEVKDLTSYLLMEKDSDGKTIPLQDLELEASVVIQASTGTMFWFLTFAIYFVVAHPRIHMKLLSELREACHEGVASVDLDKLAAVSILDPIITETLRLVAPWFMTRIVPPGGTTIGNHFIPGYTTVVSPSFTQQTSEENFSPRPKDFYPERWLPDESGKTAFNKQAVVQFSSGPYGCPGKSLAMMELRHVIACLFLTFDFSFPPLFDSDKFVEGFKFSGQAFFDRPLTLYAIRRG